MVILEWQGPMVVTCSEFFVKVSTLDVSMAFSMGRSRLQLFSILSLSLYIYIIIQYGHTHIRSFM